MKEQNHSLFLSQMSNPSPPPPPQNKPPTNLTLSHDLLNHPNTQQISDSDTSFQDDSYNSDCESGISDQILHNAFLRLDEREHISQIINKKFVSSFASSGYAARIDSIHRNVFSGVMNRVKYHSFSLYAKGMEIKRHGDANAKYAWYGASKDELHTILTHGFTVPSSTRRDYGHGVYLSPADHPVQSMQFSTADEHGVRYMLLCRVILGNMEVVNPGSGSRQYVPSSEEFDSGVDNILSPNKYIIWNGNMNTHILPEFLVSFKASSCRRGCHKNNPKSSRIPQSDWMPFTALISDLSKYLPDDAIGLISKNHSDYRKQKITRREMIQCVRRIAGDKLLIMIIKSCKGKRFNIPGVGSQAAYNNMN